jgi:predicted negative regulator of RcsB-dependent stress response
VAEDKNQTVKKQLLKKREESARKKVPLAPGEMVDDALARGMAGGGRWLKKNFGTLQWVIVGAIAAGIGYAVYDHRMDKRAEQASGELMKGALSERGRIAGTSAPPKPEEDTVEDRTPVFKSADERRETALASYHKVVSSYPGTGAAILARMGEAGILFDKRDWDGAVTAYREVKESALAKADVTVRGRAIEGAGLALESKGDIDNALKSFRELENTDVRGLKELGMYHQARILFAKGDTDKPKELLKNAREKLNGASSGNPAGPAGESHPFAFLESQIDDLLRRIDPTAVPASAPPSMGGMPPGMGDPSQMTPEKLQRLQEQLKRSMQEAKNKLPPPAPIPAPAGSK